MSCNQPIYEEEEQACRDTFLKDADSANIPYYFYKGTDGELSVDQKSHTMLLPVPDDLVGTSKKTVMAFLEALKMDDWDYVLKTNVSTWLDIKKIVEAVDSWEGREDRNIYGARFLANDASKKVPFPRGHFTILSRSLVEGIVKWSPKLIVAEGMPKTDDTLICLSLLYHVQKVIGDNYLDRLKEVPAVNYWSDEIQELPEFGTALSIRCKDEEEPDKTPERMRIIDKLKRGRKKKMRHFRPIKLIETKFGFQTLENYQKLILIENKIKEKKENPHQ